MKQKLSFIFFAFSLLFFSYGFGFMTAFKTIPPYDLLLKVYHAWPDLVQYWKNDTGLVPLRHLVSATPGRKQISILDESGMAEGYRLIAGLMPRSEAWVGAVLYDQTGKEVHYWPVDYAKLDSEGPGALNVFMHGVAIFEDGSLIVNFDGGNALAKISFNGEVLWKIPGLFHHLISRSYDGTIWTWEGEEGHQFMTQVDPDDGYIIRRVSLIDDVVVSQNLEGRFAIQSSGSENGLRWFEDPFHPNDIEILDPHLSKAFPLFSAGDLLISLRNLNLVAVLDSRTYQVKWSSIGPWHRQHDPDFLPDGSISVFNNNMGLAHSQIVKIDPQTKASQIFVGQEQGLSFYTWQRGNHQFLENGNVLITDTEHGRVLEANSRGDLVWEYHNIYDEERNGVINTAVQLPLDFFHEEIRQYFDD